MNLIDLPMNVPWLSLVWLSLVIPTLIIALLKPEQKREIRIVGAVFSFISLALTLLVYLAYDYRSPQQFQFLEEVPWLPELGINYILGVDGVSLPMLLLNGLVIFTGALISWNIEERSARILGATVAAGCWRIRRLRVARPVPALHLL